MTQKKKSRQEILKNSKIRTEDILAAFDKFVKENGYPPTVREIQKMTKTKSTATVHYHIQKLIEDGILINNDKSPRTLRRTWK